MNDEISVGVFSDMNGFKTFNHSSCFVFEMSQPTSHGSGRGRERPDPEAIVEETVEKRKAKTKGSSRSKKAGLTFPVGRVNRMMKQQAPASRIGEAASIMTTAILEYVAAEVFEMAGTVAKDNKKQRIMPRHIMCAIKSDAEINKLLGGVVIPQAGVLPHIEEVLVSGFPLGPSRRKKFHAFDDNVPPHRVY